VFFSETNGFSDNKNSSAPHTPFAEALHCKSNAVAFVERSALLSGNAPLHDDKLI